MPVIADKINKILYITSHKCGICTISTFVMNTYFDNTYKEKYYMDELRELNLVGYNDEYKDYYKILILRDPYKRFISGFLQDISTYGVYKNQTIELSFYDFCKYIESIYQTPNIDYLIENDTIKYLSTNITSKKASYKKTLLNHHFETQYSQLYWDLKHINNVDLAIMLEDLTDTLNFVKKKYNLSTNILFANAKKYTASTLDVINTPINDLKHVREYPYYTQFYNTEIKNICEKIYDEDFTLIQKYGLNDKITKI